MTKIFSSHWGYHFHCLLIDLYTVTFKNVHVISLFDLDLVLFTELKGRDGSTVDANNLARTFSALGFDVDQRPNTSGVGMRQAMAQGQSTSCTRDTSMIDVIYSYNVFICLIYMYVIADSFFLQLPRTTTRTPIASPA